MEHFKGKKKGWEKCSRSKAGLVGAFLSIVMALMIIRYDGNDTYLNNVHFSIWIHDDICNCMLQECCDILNELDIYTSSWSIRLYLK
jgi:hypothetical protein